jgi:hypothetical protein
MNSNPYATGRIWKHPDVEALEPHPVSASMSQMPVAAHDPKSKVGPC